MIKEAFLQGFCKRGSKLSRVHTGLGSMEKRVRAGYRRSSGSAGGLGGSLFALPVEWVSKKMFGKGKVNRALRNVNQAGLKADTLVGRAGHAVTKHLPKGFGKDLFVQKDLVPVGRGLHKEVRRTSALAPANKAMGIAAPIVVGVILDKQFRKVKHSGQQPEKISR